MGKAQRSKICRRYGMFSLSRRPLSRATSLEWCRKAQLDSKSAETLAAARALFLKGAISIESNTRGCGFVPAFKFPLQAKMVFNKAWLRTFISVNGPRGKVLTEALL